VIRRIILDDIRDAEARGDRMKAIRLKLVLKHFCDTRPENPKVQAGRALT
jgi:hypothetical protein